MQQTAHRPKNATLERGMLLTIRAHPSYPCRSVCYSGSPGLARRCGCGLIEIEKYIRYAPRAAGLKPSAMQDEARLRGLFQTTRHPCASVISVPIRVLFRLSEAKPACASTTLLVRAEALPECVEAPAGLWRSHR